MPRAARTPLRVCWVFTLNNWNDQMIVKLHDFLNEMCKYAIYQKEVGENGTPHLQGYMELSSEKRMLWIKRKMDIDSIHLEPRHGTRDQARDYCMKEDTRVPDTLPVEFGSFKTRQGERTDISSLRQDIVNGTSTKELWDNHTVLMLKYTKGVREMRDVYREKRDFKSHVSIFWGVAGRGKSRVASMYPTPYFVPCTESTVWFDNYDPDEHETVVFDDYKGGMSLTTFKRICDRYPCMVPTKGGHVEFKPKWIVFTSNRDPMHWYSKVFRDNMEEWNAFRRRVEVAIEFNIASCTVWKAVEDSPLPVEVMVHMDESHSFYAADDERINHWTE